MNVRSPAAWTDATSGTTRGSEVSPELMACAVVTMPLWPSWRKMTERRVTGAPEAVIRSWSTFPAPTLGSWSVSPTSRRWAREGTAWKSAEASHVSSIETSSTMRKSVASGCDSFAVNPAAGSYLSSLWIVEA
jgi:hypothetical protein